MTAVRTIPLSDSAASLSTSTVSEHRTAKTQRRRGKATAAQRMRVIGYVRVSTERQAQEGISLDAQRSRLRAHCRAQDIALVDIVTDDGYSAKSLERPGLRQALRMLEQGKADAIIVVKLDRLTRSVKDLGHLCDTYFREGMPYFLLSVCNSIDTRSAGGKLILNVLMSVAQWEREAIGERTQEALSELKRQGVRLGGAPYGWRYSDDVDAHGRRYLVEVPEEQKGIRRICELYEADVYMRDICKMLDAEGIPARGPKWHKFTLYRVLARAGYADPHRPRKSAQSKQERLRAEQSKINRDKNTASTRAAALRAQGLSLRQIGDRLQGERILPPRGERWHAASVAELLRSAACSSAEGLSSRRKQRAHSLLRDHLGTSAESL
jgi:DNA invertase Pin-like site-specific DNA recombinase